MSIRHCEEPAGRANARPDDRLRDDGRFRSSSLRGANLGLAIGFARNDEVYTGSAIEYFTWLSAKLDSIEAMPSSRVSLVFRNAS